MYWKLYKSEIMTDTIVIARDMIRQLGDHVKTCDSEVPLMVHRTMEIKEERIKK